MKTHDTLLISSPALHVIEPQAQTHWGWLIVLYIFLGGAGAGTFLTSFIMLSLDEWNNVARIGLFIGPMLVSIGALLLLLDLGSPFRAFRLFINPSTWMSSWLVRGSYILTLFIILGLSFALLQWTHASGRGLGTVAAILAIFVLVEPGLLLAVNNSIPLWNTSALPALFSFSGLNAGLAILTLLSAVLPSTIGVKELYLLNNISSAVLLLLLVVLTSFVEIVRQTSQTAALSVRMMLSPLFVWGGILAGMLLPFALLLFSATVSDGVILRAFGAIASILILIGGLLLRLGIVKCGLRLPVIC